MRNARGSGLRTRTRRSVPVPGNPQMLLEKAIKLFMIHLGNEEVRDQVEICPGLRYAFVKVTDGTMTATKAHGAGLRKRSLTNASLRTRVPDANRTDKLTHREHLSARALSRI